MMWIKLANFLVWFVVGWWIGVVAYDVAQRKKKRRRRTGCYIWCAVDNVGTIEEVDGRYYFSSPRVMRGGVAVHNLLFPDDLWRVAQFELVEVTDYE